MYFSQRNIYQCPKGMCRCPAQQISFKNSSSFNISALFFTNLILYEINTDVYHEKNEKYCSKIIKNECFCECNV